MSEAKRFWCHEAQNLRCVRESDYDASLAREAALREELATSRAAFKEELDGVKYTRRKYRQERDDLQQRLTEAEKRALSLDAFAKEMVDAAFEGGSLDGSDIQDIAVKHGLLRIENRTEECGEVCACAGFGFPIECYRKTDLIALKPAEGEGS